MGMPIPPRPGFFPPSAPPPQTTAAPTTKASDPATTASVSVSSQPKVVYAAAPVINKPAITTRPKKKLKKEPSQEQQKPDEKKEKPADATPAKDTKEAAPVAPGIQINVPVEEIEAERANVTPFGVPGGSVDMMGLDGMDMDAAGTSKKEKKEKKRKFIRTAAGTTWEDPTLGDWNTGKTGWLA